MADALLIFKPDAAYRLAVRAGLWSWLASERDWKVQSLAWFQPPASLIESHYDFLKGRPFFPWLVDFMTALPLIVGRVTASDDALKLMRYDLGETRIAQSRPGSLRERYGIFGGLNCLHLSDAPETGAAEVEKWSKVVQLDKIAVELETAQTSRTTPTTCDRWPRRWRPASTSSWRRRSSVSCWPRSRRSRASSSKRSTGSSWGL